MGACLPDTLQDFEVNVKHWSLTFQEHLRGYNVTLVRCDLSETYKKAGRQTQRMIHPCQVGGTVIGRGWVSRKQRKRPLRELMVSSGQEPAGPLSVLISWFWVNDSFMAFLISSKNYPHTARNPAQRVSTRTLTVGKINTEKKACLQLVYAPQLDVCFSYFVSFLENWANAYKSVRLSR